MQGVWVRSLARKPRSHVPMGMAKKKKKITFGKKSVIIAHLSTHTHRRACKIFSLSFFFLTFIYLSGCFVGLSCGMQAQLLCSMWDLGSPVRD